MGRHKKLPASSQPEADSHDSDTTSSLSDIESGLREAFATCQDMVRSGDVPVQVLRELGGLGRAITAVQAERRAQVKARNYTAKNIPPEIVMEHLRLLHPDQRAHIVRELIAMDEEASVLG